MVPRTVAEEERLDEYLGVAAAPDLTGDGIELVDITGSSLSHLVQVWVRSFVKSPPNIKVPNVADYVERDVPSVNGFIGAVRPLRIYFPNNEQL